MFKNKNGFKEDEEIETNDLAQAIQEKRKA